MSYGTRAAGRMREQKQHMQQACKGSQQVCQKAGHGLEGPVWLQTWRAWKEGNVMVMFCYRKFWLVIRRMAAATRLGKLLPSTSAVFVCDVQERFRSVITGYPNVIDTTRRVVRNTATLLLRDFRREHSC